MELCLYCPHTSGEKRPGHEADSQLVSSLEMNGAVPVLPPYISMACAGAVLVSLEYSLVISMNLETYNFVVFLSF